MFMNRKMNQTVIVMVILIHLVILKIYVIELLK